MFLELPCSLLAMFSPPMRSIPLSYILVNLLFLTPHPSSLIPKALTLKDSGGRITYYEKDPDRLIVRRGGRPDRYHADAGDAASPGREPLRFFALGRRRPVHRLCRSQTEQRREGAGDRPARLCPQCLFDRTEQYRRSFTTAFDDGDPWEPARLADREIQLTPIPHPPSPFPSLPRASTASRGAPWPLPQH